MKSFIKNILLLGLLVVTVSVHGADSVYVRGNVRQSGTYVAPHYRSAPDHNFYNNWSTKGNVNPFTGTAGTRVTPPSYSAPGVRLTPLYSAPAVTYSAPSTTWSQRSTSP